MHKPAAIAGWVVAAAFASAAPAQDLAVVAIDAPAGGCALGANETVTVRLFNHGVDLPAGTMFDIDYTINAGAPVVETIVLASLLPTHSHFVYTFATPANLSLPGTYGFGTTVALGGDVNPTNNAFYDHAVTNWAPSVGGTVSGPAVPVLAGTVALSGWTGDIVEWQQSEDGGRRWRRLANTASTQAFDPLLHDTAFRALVRNGACPPALSNAFPVASSDPLFYSGFEP